LAFRIARVFGLRIEDVFSDDESPDAAASAVRARSGA
jgi:DNA-binding XRE family transcriptional regulator